MRIWFILHRNEQPLARVIAQRVFERAEPAERSRQFVRLALVDDEVLGGSTDNASRTARSGER